jgi:hypothetical protein
MVEAYRPAGGNEPLALSILLTQISSVTMAIALGQDPHPAWKFEVTCVPNSKLFFLCFRVFSLN